MATIKKKPAGNAGRQVKKRVSHTPLMWTEINTVTMEVSVEFFKKIKIELPYDPSIPPWIYIPGNKSQNTIQTLAHPRS
jgi:nitrogen-specific signal transduction histidine kinase